MADSTAGNADTLPFTRHDHRRCVRSALATAQALCRERGARLTPLRQQVLELVWQSHRPLGAYTILEQLAEQARMADAGGDDDREGKKRNMAPPTVYRALDFLQEHGLVHRLASINAYLGCLHPGEHHQSQFLICRGCERAVELNDTAVGDALGEAAARAGFRQESACIEILGRCPDCR